MDLWDHTTASVYMPPVPPLLLGVASVAQKVMAVLF